MKFLIPLAAFSFFVLSCSTNLVESEAPVNIQREVSESKNFTFEPLMWELKKKDDHGQVYELDANYQKRLPRMKLWTAKVYEVIKNETDLLGQNVADDIEYFCPRYRDLSENQRLNFWGQMIAAMTYKESGWIPTTRYRESKADFPKGDAVTKQPYVYSEGLMQLSYQDGANYKESFDCGFDWKQDRKLDPKDPEKTIFAPYRNLRCGILILNHKVVANRRIMSSGMDWSVLRSESHKNSQVKWIAAQTKSLTFCPVKSKK